MATSLNPEDITVVQSADAGASAHDGSRGKYDDQDSSDSGLQDAYQRTLGNYTGPVDDND
ncbi:hypothetical protein [Kitasatospora sp. GP82]|uniref:hypothetical protein n=1 Tax=Kitasatospora sp. GP82 TaxID=3035089 RepID=UPI0024742438|nr:hypothetical protein [Kitasatospora sp. GP82]MDH6123597.1 hypothetical protein [Kitasatospora sp. GP82]